MIRESSPNQERAVPREKTVPRLTAAQYEKFTSCEPDDPELLKWMEDNGVKFNSGIIDVEIDGKPAKIHTVKTDFGTKVFEEISEEQKGYSRNVLRAVLESEKRRNAMEGIGGYRRIRSRKGE
jgi:hypothetical protein